MTLFPFPAFIGKSSYFSPLVCQVQPWQSSRCLIITEKVSFNIASYVYILSGQKLIKNAKKWSSLASFCNPKACGQTVLPDRSVLIGQKLVENAKIKKCDILSNFQTM